MITTQKAIDLFLTSPAYKKALKQKKKLPTDVVIHLGTQIHGKKGSPYLRHTIRVLDISRDRESYSFRTRNVHVNHLSRKVRA